MTEHHKIQFKAKSPDVSALMEIQKRNIETLTAVNKLALEGFQAIAERQREIFSQVIKDTSEMIGEVSQEGTPQGKAIKHADLTQKAYDKTVKHWHELADLIGDSTKEATDIIHERVGSSLEEFKSAFEEKNVRKKAA